jgi:hypothetical protein
MIRKRTRRTGQAATEAPAPDLDPLLPEIGQQANGPEILRLLQAKATADITQKAAQGDFATRHAYYAKAKLLPPVHSTQGTKAGAAALRALEELGRRDDYDTALTAMEAALMDGQSVKLMQQFPLSAQGHLRVMEMTKSDGTPAAPQASDDSVRPTFSRPSFSGPTFGGS